MAGVVSVLLVIGVLPGTAASADTAGRGRPAFDVRPAHEVIKRLVGPRYAAQVSLETLPGDRDAFRVSGRHRRLVIAGSSSPALLMGFNWYLKHVVKADISWTGDQLDLPKRLPLPAQPIEQSSVVKHRFAGNDTEDGYSGPYRTFEDWERLIDVYALHGVNEMFMPVGTEAVYFETLQSFGYSADEVRSWIPGAGYQPWWLLQNMSNFTSPISEDQIRDRAKLGRRIADRMRQVGITPVLPGYFGTVPTDFETRNPGAVTVPQGTWQGFTRPDWLAPTNPVFGKVAERFYGVQDRLLGKSTMYKMDLLHEGGKAGDIPVGQASVAVQDALEKAHPGATWVILGWQSNPRAETVAAVDRSRMLIVDGLSDRALKVDRDADWKGTPYAFGSIWNFGGNSTVGAPVGAWNERFWAWRARAGGSALDGIAIMPEASYNNPVAVEFLAELPWHDGPVDVHRWFDEYADARYGGADPHARAAWRVLADTAYAIPPTGGRSSGHGGLFAAAPSLAATRPHRWAQAAFAYDPAAFARALPELLAVDRSLRGSSAYRYDLLEVARQAVADRSRTLLPQINAAYQARDLATFTKLTDSWIGHIKGLDALTGTDRGSMVGPWLQRARQAAGGPAEARQLEYEARKLITSWGESNTDLHDYAYREWSGVLRDYYAPRWAKLFDGLKEALRTGGAPAAFDWYAMAEAWSKDGGKYPTKPSGDTYTEASKTLRRLMGDSYDLRLALRPTGSLSGSAEVAASVTNTNYFAPMSGLTFDVSAPAGVEARPAGPEKGEIDPGATLEQSWTLHRTDALPEGTTQVAVEFTVGFDQAGQHLTRKATAVLPVAADGRVQLSDLPFTYSSNHDGIYAVARDTVTPGTPEGNGKPIRLDGTFYSKGLGTNANADVRFALNQGCQRFTTVVGIDDAMNHTADGDVIVRVFGDGRMLHETGVLRSGLATSGAEAVRLDVDVADVKELRLVVDQYDVNRWFDAVSFGVPTLTCTSPPATR